MKILSKKEYKRLKDIENKYYHLTGQMFTIYIGGRSRRARLMLMSKEELVRIIFNMNSELRKKVKGEKNDKRS